ncbi:MAG: UDP-N-acetylmuramate dehydrogenase [Oscillospiraceae bacterium]|nr:UDP-N-acetylmuramate dehydrogenase [Oscillospiraceae bacterium]
MEAAALTGKIIELAKDSTVLVDEPLSNLTSFKIGGPADIIVQPESIDTIVKVATFCRINKTPLSVIGNGTNLLVGDAGVRGVVMRLCGNINQLRREGNKITAGAGALLCDVAQFACDNRLSGFEFTYGIPGTVGGAIYMNAGAYGKEMRDVVTRSIYLDSRGNIGALEAASHEFGYRKSCFQHLKSIILETEFELKPGGTDEIKSLMDFYLERRKALQPHDKPSAGSVFKRPKGGFAGLMIEECGLKGCRVGDAMVSEVHAGFIVNVGNATAEDVLALISLIKRNVKKRFSVSLETEIRRIGERKRKYGN